jgi:hypothetical protein
MKNRDITNNFNKGKGKMKSGKRHNKKAKKVNKDVYNTKCVRKKVNIMTKQK